LEIVGQKQDLFLYSISPKNVQKINVLGVSKKLVSSKVYMNPCFVFEIFVAYMHFFQKTLAGCLLLKVLKMLILVLKNGWLSRWDY
jgi:hypothetical protein